MSQYPAPAPSGNPDPIPGATRTGRPLVFITAALLLGWLAWLSYTALTKSREPTVSRAQAAAARVAVVAEVTTAEADGELLLQRPGGIQGVFTTKLKVQAGKPDVIVKVIEALGSKGQPVEGEIAVLNLPVATGFAEPGQYLLLLNRAGDATVEATADAPGGGRPAYSLVGQPDSPGARLEGTGPPMIYHWGPDVRAQARRLFPTRD